jgi:hypothetical protein
MSLLPHRAINRRGFLVSGARTGGMLALATFAAWQETKRRRLANDPNCLKLSVCSECVEFGRCPKPRAQAARSKPSL